MNESEKKSLTVQIQECYSHLRNEGAGICQMFVASADDWLRETLVLKGGEQWAIQTTSDGIEQIARKYDLNVLVMSPDATEELTMDDVTDRKNLFVIGGIVDRIVSKNETSHKAIRLGMRARKLPMDPTLIRNRVFNIDSVFMFLIMCLKSNVNTRDDMLKTLDLVLPERKRGACEMAPQKSLQQPARAGEDTYEGNSVKLDSYRIMELFQ